MDSIITTNALLLDAIANLSLEDKGMIDDFEKSSAHLLMHELVAKRKSDFGTSNKDNVVHVSEANTSTSSSASGKVSKVKTGVEFRCCKRGKFMSLSKDQRDELAESRKRRQCNNESGKFRKKAKLDESNQDDINVPL